MGRDVWEVNGVDFLRRRDSVLGCENKEHLLLQI